ncbi:MAG: hypothetical protein NC827_06015 [Candidatus Omnitrophica bacterium]|nr:hypothetical protein [Candidatus Omnitrophota bacterium]
MKKVLITGNKIVDGIITIFIGLVFLSSAIFIAYKYGSPVFWWQIFGGALASLIFGFYIVIIIGGFIFFTVGLHLIVSKIFETLLIPPKAIYLSIIYIPTLICITLLTFYGILPPEIFEKMVYSILGIIIGYLVSKVEQRI